MSKEVEKYRRLVEELRLARAPRELDSPLPPDEDTSALDAQWCRLSEQERLGEEPLLYNAVGVRAYRQHGGSIMLVDVNLCFYDPNHDPVIEEADIKSRNAYVSGQMLVMELKMGRKRDRERAPPVDFIKHYSARMMLRDMSFEHVVLVCGPQVVTVTSVEKGDWVGRSCEDLFANGEEVVGRFRARELNDAYRFRMSGVKENM